MRLNVAYPAAMAQIEPGTDNRGHRARLRERLIHGGPDALLDHEVVEYLLALTIPRVDTKPLARDLIARFGGVGELLSADGPSLLHAGLSEPAAAAIRIADTAARLKLKAALRDRPILSSWQALIDYLHLDMAHRTIEGVRVLHLNTRNMLIREDIISQGSIDQAAVYVREVVRRALEYGSASIILVHNHPSGEPTPSRADIQLTREIAAGCKPLGIQLHDHVIIGSKGHASFRSLGLL